MFHTYFALKNKLLNNYLMTNCRNQMKYLFVKKEKKHPADTKICAHWDAIKKIGFIYETDFL